MSRIHATRRIHEVTGRYEEDPIRAQEEPRRHHRTRDDAALRRFGTVRPLLKVASRARPYAGSVFSNVVAALG